MSRVSPYQRMGIAQKQAAHRDRMREPAIACPLCEVQMAVPELFRHECTGRRPIHPLEAWLTASEVIALGVPESTFHRWVQAGRIQYQGSPRRRVYRRRDVARMVMWWRWRWRSPESGS